ncbi:hypothetical protein [Gordonia sp. ABSL49_1]|uniref:hypothetical protein n=1 Tax=Gordonia sp. ABSL49_1 TaxID=2920941 RepID=UPI001F0DC3F0|nr:hypothetical protein [Gordonia sp. ABSL49_1]MCH5641228.1 hypothetical protein [Gordonia sp. ABSL49_1]
MIGYYIHHQGMGHRMRAEAIAASSTVPFVALTSLADDAVPLSDSAFDEVITLDRDDTAHCPVDVDAGGALHWAPMRDRGLGGRMLQLADFVRDRRPEAVVVDVSVEVTLLLRLLGVPVIVVALPGNRRDGPHRLAHQAASAIIAAWPGDLYRPDWLTEFDAKTTYTGGISRFDGRRVTFDERHRSDVLILTGAGGSVGMPADSDEDTSRLSPGVMVRRLGGAYAPWTDDPWPYLCGAGTVVINAGQGSVADVAAAQRPAIVVPEERPFDEQCCTADTLSRHQLSRVIPSWPVAQEWPSLLRESAAAGPDWSRWRTAGAARRAAAAVESVARS